MLWHTVVSFCSTLVWGISRRLQFGPTVSRPGGFVEYSNPFPVPRSASLEKSRSDNLGIGDSDSLANIDRAIPSSSRASGRGRRLSVLFPSVPWLESSVERPAWNQKLLCSRLYRDDPGGLANSANRRAVLLAGSDHLYVVLLGPGYQ